MHKCASLYSHRSRCISRREQRLVRDTVVPEITEILIDAKRGRPSRSINDRYTRPHRPQAARCDAMRHDATQHLSNRNVPEITRQEQAFETRAFFSSLVDDSVRILPRNSEFRSTIRQLKSEHEVNSASVWRTPQL